MQIGCQKELFFFPPPPPLKFYIFLSCIFSFQKLFFLFSLFRSSLSFFFFSSNFIFLHTQISLKASIKSLLKGNLGEWIEVVIYRNKVASKHLFFFVINLRKQASFIILYVISFISTFIFFLEEQGGTKSNIQNLVFLRIYLYRLNNKLQQSGLYDIGKGIRMANIFLLLSIQID